MLLCTLLQQASTSWDNDALSVVSFLTRYHFMYIINVQLLQSSVELAPDFFTDDIVGAASSTDDSCEDQDIVSNSTFLSCNLSPNFCLVEKIAESSRHQDSGGDSEGNGGGDERRGSRRRGSCPTGRVQVGFNVHGIFNVSLLGT